MFTTNNFKSNKNTRLMQGFSLTILSIGLLASFPAAAEKYYKWVDDKGSTHYTQTPPPKAYIKKSALVDIVPTAPSSTPTPPAVPLQNQPNAAPAPAALEGASTRLESTTPAAPGPIDTSIGR